MDNQSAINSSATNITFFKAGAFLIIITAILLFIKDIAEYIVGYPPSNGTVILDWITSNKLLFIIMNESFSIATFLFIPSFIVIYYALEDKKLASIAVAIILLIVPINLVSVILQGRLIYPVFSILITNSDFAELIIALYYGGIHVTNMMIGIAISMLSFPMNKDGYGKFHLYYGIATGVLVFLIAGNPWLFPLFLFILTELLVVFWLVMVGVKILTIKRT